VQFGADASGFGRRGIAAGVVEQHFVLAAVQTSPTTGRGQPLPAARTALAKDIRAIEFRPTNGGSCVAPGFTSIFSVSYDMPISSRNTWIPIVVVCGAQ
jgi:hypothetical protein